MTDAELAALVAWAWPAITARLALSGAAWTHAMAELDLELTERRGGPALGRVRLARRWGKTDAATRRIMREHRERR